jgi:hypothetical protein
LREEMEKKKKQGVWVVGGLGGKTGGRCGRGKKEGKR